MGAAKCNVEGSDYVGVFATASDKHIFLGHGINWKSKQILIGTLNVTPIVLSIFGTNLVGLFLKANSNGLLISNIIEDYELKHLMDQKPDLNIEILESNLNAVGNNILANDKIAIVNPDYSVEARKQIGDVLNVEVVDGVIGGFKTVGANNILTNKGFVISNRSTDEQKGEIDKLTGFDSMRTTANTGSLNVGLSAVGNSRGIVVGDDTTGYELARITDALDIND